MYFVIRTVVAAGTQSLRDITMPAHQAYLAHHRLKILALGPLLGNKAATIGSMCVIEVDSLLAAIQFVEDDPMVGSGSHELIEIVEWQMSGWDRQSMLTC
jgi:uncharacterized protein YciI